VTDIQKNPHERELFALAISGSGLDVAFAKTQTHAKRPTHVCLCK
jgi:hypothetical protein